MQTVSNDPDPSLLLTLFSHLYFFFICLCFLISKIQRFSPQDSDLIWGVILSDLSPRPSPGQGKLPVQLPEEKWSVRAPKSVFLQGDLPLPRL